MTNRTDTRKLYKILNSVIKYKLNRKLVAGIKSEVEMFMEEQKLRQLKIIMNAYIRQKM